MTDREKVSIDRLSSIPRSIYHLSMSTNLRPLYIKKEASKRENKYGSRDERSDRLCQWHPNPTTGRVNCSHY